MDKLNGFNDSSYEKDEINEENQKNNENNNRLEKVLCVHCRRTLSNGIRCLGICVADSDY